MKYDKPPLSLEEQADKLIGRGLIVAKEFLISKLKNVNYYRLSGYLYPYRQPGDKFKLGTTFERVWRSYTFDRRLRLLVMDAIERVEVSVRTQLIGFLAHSSGAFGYVNSTSLPNLKFEDFNHWIEDVRKEATRSKELFVKHFKDKYGDLHSDLPLWMVGEIMSFGHLLTMYKGTDDKIKKDIAAYYGVSDEVLTSWLRTINVIRNICAHHGRLWNKELGVKPLIPRKNKFPQWHIPVEIKQNRVFGVLTILNYLLKIIAPQSKWKVRLFNFLEEYPEISRWSMGFPDSWKESELWK